jgi:signal transduction histidine kinase
VGEAWQQWGQVAAGLAWAALVVAVARWRVGLALLIGASANLVQLADLNESQVWPAAVSATAGVLAGRRMPDTFAPAAIFSGVGGAGLLLAVALGNAWDWFAVALWLLCAGVLPWLAGRYARLRAMLVEAGWHRAEQLEREQLLVAREARLRERTRIARDMHDSLGHELSLIAMRAGALELDAALAEEHRAAIGQLRATSVAVAERLAGIVGVLRGVDAEPPTPADEPIDGLVARTRASGVDIELDIEGLAGVAPSLVDRTAYRVVQEALTNAVKHAPGAIVRVRLAYGDTALSVTVRNGTPAGDPQPASGGRGLPGLRERVRLVGGSLRTGGQSDGGYEVAAELPYAGGVAQSGNPMSQARRVARRGLAAAVAVPVAIGTAVVVLLLGMRWHEVTYSFLDPATYASLAVGQPRASSVLPANQVDGRPDVPEPPIPAGARCEYYRMTRELFAGPIDVYRLCFADGRLVDKTVVAGTAP